MKSHLLPPVYFDELALANLEASTAPHAADAARMLRFYQDHAAQEHGREERVAWDRYFSDLNAIAFQTEEGHEFAFDVAEAANCADNALLERRKRFGGTR